MVVIIMTSMLVIYLYIYFFFFNDVSSSRSSKKNSKTFVDVNDLSYVCKMVEKNSITSLIFILNLQKTWIGL